MCSYVFLVQLWYHLTSWTGVAEYHLHRNVSCCLIIMWMWTIYKVKIISPSIEPCGTPWLTLLDEDDSSFTWTNCHLSHKDDWVLREMHPKNNESVGFYTPRFLFNLVSFFSLCHVTVRTTEFLPGTISLSALSVTPQHCGQWTASCVKVFLQTPPRCATSAVLSCVRCLHGERGDPAPMKTVRRPRKTRPLRRVGAHVDNYIISVFLF